MSESHRYDRPIQSDHEKDLEAMDRLLDDRDVELARLRESNARLLEALKSVQGAIEMIASAFKEGSPTADVLTETAATARAAIAAEGEK